MSRKRSESFTVTYENVKSLEGWLQALDYWLLDRFLRQQAQSNLAGDVVELGVFKGKSAVLLGNHVGPQERFIVIDLFEQPDSTDVLNAEENKSSYEGLSRASFEKNYLSYHEQLPEIHVCLSSEFKNLSPEASCRFVHVDASHLYEHVREDISNARAALVPEGMVVLDDYRSTHTPGVAAAAWEAVLATGLKPIVLSEDKLYGTWGEGDLYLDGLEDQLVSFGWLFEKQYLLNHEVLRVWRDQRSGLVWSSARNVRRVLRRILD